MQTSIQVTLQDNKGTILCQPEVRFVAGGLPEVVRWRDRDFIYRGNLTYSTPKNSTVVGFNPDSDGTYRG